MSDLDRGTVLHFMRQALREFVPPRTRDRNNTFRPIFLSDTLKKLLEANLVDPALVGNCDFEQLCSQCQFFEETPSELASLLIVLTEAYFYLLSVGYIVPLPFQSQSRLPFNFDRFLLTQLGCQWARGEDP